MKRSCLKLDECHAKSMHENKVSCQRGHLSRYLCMGHFVIIHKVTRPLKITKT